MAGHGQDPQGASGPVADPGALRERAREIVSKWWTTAEPDRTEPGFESLIAAIAGALSEPEARPPEAALHPSASPQGAPTGVESREAIGAVRAALGQAVLMSEGKRRIVRVPEPLWDDLVRAIVALPHPEARRGTQHCPGCAGAVWSAEPGRTVEPCPGALTGVELREALCRYGVHLVTCESHHSEGGHDYPCTCGLTAALHPERSEAP